jgi:FkbM family methyltransferase
MNASLWRLRQLGKSKAIHRAATVVTDLIFPHGKVTRIWRGQLRGWHWYRHRDHQFWMPLGAYEEETVRWLASNLGPSSVFFDIGGNAGYFTLLGSKLVGESGRVVCFEPVPVNVETILRQVDLNKCSNVTVEPVALADRVGLAAFAVESRNANSHLADVSISHAASMPQRTLDVQVTTLDDWLTEHHCFPDVLKIDVEGAEVKLLHGAVECLRTARPRMVISTHGTSLREECIRLLRDANYDVVPVPGFAHELLAYPRVRRPQ